MRRVRRSPQSGIFHKPLILFLFVEGQRDTRLANATLLRRAGFRLMESGNGVNGVECVLTFRPDLVLLDLSIPLVDGYEAVRRLGSDARTTHVPVVILSGLPVVADPAASAVTLIETLNEALTFAAAQRRQLLPSRGETK